MGTTTEATSLVKNFSIVVVNLFLMALSQAIIWIIQLPVLLALSFYGGWVAQNLWEWFIVPFGAPQVDVWVFTGIAAVMMFLLGKRIKDRYTDKLLGGVKWHDLIPTLMAPFAIFGLGWVINHFFITG